MKIITIFMRMLFSLLQEIKARKFEAPGFQVSYFYVVSLPSKKKQQLIKSAAIGGCFSNGLFLFASFSVEGWDTH